MQIEGEVTVEGMAFMAKHGYYPEERVIGNSFLVDVQVFTLFTKAAQEDKLSGTINYENIYSLTAAVMLGTPQHLLEHLAYLIATDVKQSNVAIISCRVTVSKLKPPIGGVCQKATVSLSL